MDEEENQDLREYFDACDHNGDGTIQYEEFVALLHNLGADMEEHDNRIGFGEVDTDRDGAIDFDEFLVWWREH